MPASRIARTSPRFDITVPTTTSPFSVPRSCIASALAARTWSPSITLPAAWANRARGASPSWLTPTSAPSRTTSAATTSGWSAPHPSLILRPSGSAWIAGTPAPRARRTALRRRAVRAVDADPHAVQTDVRRALEVEEVALLALRRGGDPSTPPRGTRRTFQLELDLVLDVIGQLHPLAREELDPVVVRRVVRSADHDPRRGAELDRHVRDRGRRLDAGEQDIAPRLGDAVGQRVLEPFPRLPGVPADHDDRRVGCARTTEHLDGRASEPSRQVP